MHPARRRRRRDGFARTRDGRGARSGGPRRRGAGRSPRTRRPRRRRLVGRGQRLVSNDTLGRSDASARRDRHPGLGCRPLRGGHGPHSLPPIGLSHRLRGSLALLLDRPRNGGDLSLLCGWLRDLGGGRLVDRLRDFRLCHLDHRRRRWRGRRWRGRRWRGRGRLQEAIALRPPPDAVGLSLDDARGVGLDPDAERETEFERLLVGQPELFGEFMDADLAWQTVPPSGLCCAVARPGSVPRARRPRIPKPTDLARLNISPQRLGEGAAALGRFEAGDVVAQPGAPARAGTEPQCAAPGHANPPHLLAGATGAAADAGADRAQTLSARSAGASAEEAPLWSWAMAAVQASALTASPPSAGCQSCSPVAGSMIHSPSAHSTSP